MTTTSSRLPSAPHGAGGRRRTFRAISRSTPLVPALILLAIFLVGPMGFALWGSLTNAALTGYRAAKPQFIGLDNYAALFADADFWNSVVLTLVFVLFSAIIGQNVLGLAIAVLLRASSRIVSTIVSTLVVVAWVLPEIVAAFALYAFFSADGTLNSVLDGLGLGSVSWLIDYPMLSVILANIWRGTAFSMLVYNAALGEVPPEITEAAQIDGTNTVQRFFLVTLPMIRRSIATNLMLTTLQTLGTFGLIWVMTGGGPGTRSSTLPVLAYQEAFRFAQVGYGTAIAAVTIVLGAVFAAIYIKILKPEVES
ncbi:sugar ABC transporter permease [Microbacterium sp. cx-55]|uniref:carbohydrate ABC transporter permease n=1 Tax=unclassified Microbacterium TaxID=2609290 RepID=UPI001CC0248F|nr:MULTISPECIES: sugar ABC transporter permease [unclassified Microbacterium]MBZ4487852.1 sugar ABC transporter permease [Microbacterium sp. cx-55]MCC4909122.1 sugar ABC transporter permease [Microbacterium sp. cx-59]UGB34737.1 sugar ABC transporter permease [Microbacterium sp. cx-55]